MENNTLPSRELAPGYYICPLINGLWQTAGGHGEINIQNARVAMKELFDAGFTTFDGADHYGPAELLMGDLYENLSEEGKKKTQLFTKWCPSPMPMTQNVVDSAINRSLKRMKTTCLDMLQFHWWDYSDKEYITALTHMKNMQQNGPKIKYLSLTNFNTEYLQKIIDAGIKITSNQVSYSIIDWRPELLMVPLCQKHDIKLLTYGTLLGGLLSEKYLNSKEPRGPELNTSSLKKYKRFVDSWGPWSLFQQLLNLLDKIAKNHKVSIANVAVKYILDKPMVGGVIIGCRLGITSTQHIENNKMVFSFDLTPEETQSITELSRKGRVLGGDCGDEYRN
eukprot:TRINITY_DN9617_c0_g1_i1.p1 TRINITY_DN9617_c0_g1~~TRINITY_DN9617_c0_g1_i1.p1  ORF type:complete len:336 (-),score=57.64 TRINITY_DN9617_c0_g1_i1:13-1020(-)